MDDINLKTAKELVFVAWCEGRQIAYPDDVISEDFKWRMRFEEWWKRYVLDQEHSYCLFPKHSVFIDGKRYIQAE